MNEIEKKVENGIRKKMENETKKKMENEIKKKMENEIKNETTKEVKEVFGKLERNLPTGWKIRKGMIEVMNEIYSVKGEDMLNEEQNVKKITDEFTKMDNILPPGWKLKGASVKQNSEAYNIKRLDDEYFREERKDELEELWNHSKELKIRLRRMEERFEHSRRLDQQERSNQSKEVRSDLRRSSSRERRSFQTERKSGIGQERENEYETRTGKLNKNIPPGWKPKILNTKRESLQTHEINYSQTKQRNETTNKTEEYVSEENVKEMITKTVYSEGNLDVDPFNAIVDTGCPKTVCGKVFMDSFLASKGENVFVRRKYENENFKFGNGQVYTSNKSHEIELEIGEKKTKIWTSVIEADIPLLLGLDYLKLWGVVIDIEKENIFIKEINEYFNIDLSQTNHWKLSIQKRMSKHKQAHKLVLKVDLCGMNDRDLESI